MPSLLKKGARCPRCSTPLVAIVRTQHPYGQGTTAEYFHEKGWDGQDQISPKVRRKMRCKVFYPDGVALPDLDYHRSVA